MWIVWVLRFVAIVSRHTELFVWDKCGVDQYTRPRAADHVKSKETAVCDTCTNRATLQEGSGAVSTGFKVVVLLWFGRVLAWRDGASLGINRAAPHPQLSDGSQKRSPA